MKLAYKVALASALLGGANLAQAQHTQVFRSEERFFHEGIELFDREKYGPAQEAFRKYIELIGDPEKSSDAQYYYALSGLYLLHPDAEQLIMAFTRNFPAHPKTALANYELGLYYFENKDYKRATELLTLAPTHLLSITQNKELDFKIGYSYFALKDFTKAKPYFDKTKTTGFREDDHRFAYAANYYAGYIAYRNGDYAAAKNDFKIAEKNEAYKTIVPYMITEILYKENDVFEVIRYGEASLKATPKPQQADEIALLVGDAYYQRGDYKTASTYFAQYTQGKKTLDEVVQYKIGYTDYKNNDFKNAIVNFKDIALKKNALGQNAAYYLGLSYLKENNKPFALTAFDQARKNNLDKDVTQAATLKYAQVNYELGNLREVISSLANFNRDFPDSELGPDADNLLSEAYFNSNNYPEAIKHIESLPKKSWRILQTYQRVTFYHAVNLFNEAKFPQAVTMLDKSLEYPYDKDVTAASHFIKGEAYSIGQRFNDAINSYGAVFRNSPSTTSEYYVKARYGIGYAYYNTKQYDKALGHFKAYIESIQPSNTNYHDATLRLGDTYYVNKNYNEALGLYERVLASSSPERDYAFFQKGVILGITGKREQAIQTLQNVVTQYPNSRYVDAAMYQSALLYFEAGNYQPAINGFTTLIQKKPESRLIPNALQKRGIAYSNMQRHNEAAQDFKRVLDEYPSSNVASGVLYSLQDVLSTVDRGDEFDTYLARFKAANPESNATESVEFEAAKSLYFNEKYSQAIPRLEAFIKTYPNSSFASNARYFLADSYLRTNPEQGLTFMKAVVNENKSEYVNRAILKVAEVEFQAKNYPEAIKYYTRLRDLANNRNEQANALIGLMMSYYLTADYTSSKRIASDLIMQGNSALNALNTALLYRGKATYAQNDLPQALTELREAAKTASDVNGAEAHYLVTEILYKQKKYKEAFDLAFIEFPKRFSNYDFWLGKNYLLISDIFVAQNELGQAKMTLESIISGSTLPEIVAEAKEKLARLNTGGAGTGTGTSTGTGTGTGAGQAPAQQPQQQPKR